MAQKRIFEFEADDSTFEINQRYSELIKPGLYHGFDAQLNTGLNLVLEHTTSGVVTVDEDELYTDPKGVYITKQGVTIKEDESIVIPIDVGGSLPRIDLIVAEHIYLQVTGGQPSIYSVIKGTPSATPVPPSLTTERRQLILGMLYVPANMSSLDDANVVYTKSIQPDFAGNGFLARIEALENWQTPTQADINSRFKISNNLSEGTPSTMRNNLQLGNHVTYNFIGSGGNYGSQNNIARGDHLHTNVYEPVFTKNSAFNKNFGTASGTVCQGNDSRLSNSRKCDNTFDNAETARNNLQLGNHVTHNYSGSGGDHGSENSVARGDHSHPASDITSTLSAFQIPNLDASKITTGTLSTLRIPSLDASKITTGTLSTSRIPSLDASKITSGTFSADRIPSLDSSKITSGTLNSARIPSLDASKITTGTLSINRIPTITYSKLDILNYIRLVNNASNTVGTSTSSVLSAINNGGYVGTRPIFRSYLKGAYTNFELQHQFDGQIACPYVYIEYNEKKLFVNEILKEARYTFGEKTETLRIPEFIIQSNKLKLYITEEKDEVTFINSILLTDGSKTLKPDIDFSKDLVLRKGELIELSFNIKDFDKKNISLVATGFYLPLKKVS